MTERHSIIEDDGRVFEAYLAHSPRTPQSPLAAVLLLPEMFGPTPAMRAAAADFASAGYPTAVVNVFWRSAHAHTLDYEGEDRARAWTRVQALDLGKVVADIDMAATWLEAETDASFIFALGHCIGGRLAMLALPLRSIAGAISYYGLGISKQGAALAQVEKPAQLHYGLADEHVPRAEIDAVAALAAGNPAIKIFRYEGAGHSFCNPNRPMYDAEAAASVRRRTLAFLADPRAPTE